jgi:hypothetical protein
MQALARHCHSLVFVFPQLVRVRLCTDYSLVAKAWLLRYRISSYQRSVQTYGDYRRRAFNALSHYSACFPPSFFRPSPHTNSLYRPSFPINSPSRAGRDRLRKDEAVSLREAQSRRANSVGGRRRRQGIERNKNGGCREQKHAHHE